jgi:hypothetical protein
MKNLTKHIITAILAGILCLNLHAQSVTTTDSKDNPVTVDLQKHPEVLAKVQKDLKTGKIAFNPSDQNTDTTLDLSKHPELVKAIIKNPANWPIILKAYNNSNESMTVQGKNKQVIRDILAYLISKHIIKARGDVSSFMLTDKTFTVNGKKLSGSIHEELKDKYIKTPDYIVYYGNSEVKGNGIFQRADNL